MSDELSTLVFSSIRTKSAKTNTERMPPILWKGLRATRFSPSPPVRLRVLYSTTYSTAVRVQQLCSLLLNKIGSEIRPTEKQGVYLSARVPTMGGNIRNYYSRNSSLNGPYISGQNCIMYSNTPENGKLLIHATETNIQQTLENGGPQLIGPVVHIKTKILNHFH